MKLVALGINDKNFIKILLLKNWIMKKVLWLFLALMMHMSATAQYEVGVASGVLVPLHVERLPGEKTTVNSFISLQGHRVLNKFLLVGLSTDGYGMSRKNLVKSGDGKELFELRSFYSLALSPHIMWYKNIGKGRLSVGLGYSAILALKHKNTMINRYVDSDAVISHWEGSGNVSIFSNSANVKLDYKFGFGLFVGYEYRYNISPMGRITGINYNTDVSLNLIKVGYVFGF